jgi:hypothetical protein
MQKTDIKDIQWTGLAKLSRESEACLWLGNVVLDRVLGKGNNRK